MMLVVTGVGFLIHLYSTAYMEKDPGYRRFFAYLNLFIFSMLVLILGDNLPVLFVGWEGVGLCSYLLIGFWFDDDDERDRRQEGVHRQPHRRLRPARRDGPARLLRGRARLGRHRRRARASLLHAGAGLADRQPSARDARQRSARRRRRLARSAALRSTAATLVGLALFLGCAGKSAQIPLYVWLPDAMAGPTPVTALIHAATMVTAGVYLVCRLSRRVRAVARRRCRRSRSSARSRRCSPRPIALVQNDIKKVLAYSTVSQLGFMFLGVGVGAFTAGFFHVFTHAFFKACLFLGAGSVIHAMHARIHDTDASQDMRNMGGLRKYMPLTLWTFLASCGAIVGVPAARAASSRRTRSCSSAFTSRVEAPTPARPAERMPFEWPDVGRRRALRARRRSPRR